MKMCLIHRTLFKHIVIIIGVLSLIINVIVVIPYVGDYYNRIITKKNEYFTESTPGDLVISKCLYYSMTVDGSEYYNRREYSDLLSDLKNYYFKETIRKGVGFNMAYCLAGLSYYALKTNDKDLIEYLISVADENVNKEYSRIMFPTRNVNYAPLGLLYINLYRITKDIKYLNIATQLSKDILELKNSDGIIPYHPGENYYYTDCVGMLVPFMMEYFNITGDTLAKSTALNNFWQTYRYAVDQETGIPSHGYDLYSHIKCGSSNWGRGIGWYLLAASYIPDFNDSILDATLKKIKYVQFPGDPESHYDSSTALMVEIYKNRNNPEKVVDLSFIKTHITTEGRIMDCSGDTRGYNNYSFDYGASELCQGLFFILISRQI